MSINAVQQYVRKALTNVKAPYYRNGTQAFIRPYVPGNIKRTTPQIYVWGASGTEKRTTIPRGTPLATFLPAQLTGPSSGWKQATYELSIWLVATDNNNDPDGDQRFPCLIEAVVDVLRAVQQPAELTDPTTQNLSYLMNLGEDMRWEYDVDRTLGDQRFIRSGALITCSVMEMFKA